VKRIGSLIPDRMSSMRPSPWSPTEGAVPAEWPGSEGFEERVRIFAKLFSIFPVTRGQDQKARIAAFIEETAGIPCYFLRRALSMITKTRRDFAPSIGDIHSEAALVYAELLRRGLGQDPFEASLRGLRSESISRSTPKLIFAMGCDQDPRVLEVAHNSSTPSPAGLLR